MHLSLKQDYGDSSSPGTTKYWGCGATGLAQLTVNQKVESSSLSVPAIGPSYKWLVPMSDTHRIPVRIWVGRLGKLTAIFAGTENTQHTTKSFPLHTEVWLNGYNAGFSRLVVPVRIRLSPQNSF